MSEENLEDFVCDAGNLVNTCGFCGRVHFATYSNDGLYEKNELEKLRAQAEKEPAKYIENSDASSISCGEFDGKIVVWGCKCKGIQKYDDWIWNNRRVISEFLKGRAAANLRQAQSDLEIAALPPVI